VNKNVIFVNEWFQYKDLGVGGEGCEGQGKFVCNFQGHSRDNVE